MYTVAAANATAKSIIAASGIISPAELNKGDRMAIYDPLGRLLGQTFVVSVAYVSAPPGVGPTTPDPVFQTTFSGYSYLQASSRFQTPDWSTHCMRQANDRVPNIRPVSSAWHM